MAGRGDGGDGRSLEGNIEEGEVSGTRKEKADSCYGAGVSESGGLELKTCPSSIIVIDGGVNSAIRTD